MTVKVWTWKLSDYNNLSLVQPSFIIILKCYDRVPTITGKILEYAVMKQIL